MREPLRVLHVLGKMDRGGIETWLMHLLRRIDPAEVKFDFLVETAQPAAYDDEIRALGSRIIPCRRTRQLWAYARQLGRTIRTFGPFDVVHSHADVFNGLILGVAAHVKVPWRVAHGHNDMREAGRRTDFIRRGYYSALRVAQGRHMTQGIAVSDGAARDLFGAEYASDSRIRVLPCGIDYAPFRFNQFKSDARIALGVPQDAIVIGHVGRFDPQKNHYFLLEAFAIAAQKAPRLHLLLVGGGNLRSAAEAHVSKHGLQSRVTFAGVRSDVPAVLTAMDAFAFPSLYEGLGLVLIEAQAAGLPVVVSDCIPTEALIPGHWIKRLPPASPHAWAVSMLEAASLPPDKRVRSFDKRFDIDHNLRELMSIYSLRVRGSLGREYDRTVRQVADFEERREIHPRHQECK